MEQYYFIKRNERIKLIASIANANLFNIRSRCPIFHLKAADLEINSMNPNAEIEVLLYSDFYTEILAELGLKKFTDVAVE